MYIRGGLYLEYEQGAKNHRIEEDSHEDLKNELDSGPSFYHKIPSFLDVELPFDETIQCAFFTQKRSIRHVIYGVFS